MYSLRPLTARIVRPLDAGGFWRGAETVDIDPAGRVERAPALFLPDELDRIVAHYPGVAPKDDLDRLLHTSRIEPATTAQVVPDVIVADGTLLRHGGVQVIRPGPGKRKMLRGHFATLPEAMLCADYVIDRYFGHWVADGWSREQLAIERAMVPMVLDPARFGHSEGYRALFDLPARSIADTRVRRLWLIDDRGYNPARMERFRRVRARLRAAVAGRGGGDKVFIRRGAQAAGRNLCNEAEVIAALSARGFTIIAPDTLPVAQIAGALRDARIVVGVEGSALAHANAVLDPGACVFAIQSPASFNTIHRLATADVGLRFAFSVGDVATGDDFTMPVARLLRAIDMVEAAMR
ncbi:glycosyltransferase family 61 protein [uncultured Sphingomonas sp.]|uniref:glycosyltransferase family 61 protein n=1 Tax=uncultured Sphingomonas sp. TaxID=158754 RepID=UPI0030FAC411